MRSTLLSFVALAALAAVPAAAQTAIHPGPGKVVTGPPSLPSVEPQSQNASNINGGDTRSPIAPALPSANLPPNASATDYLQAARSAMAAGQTGRAQSALENAETLLLTRAVPLGGGDTPDDSPAVRNIQSALHALAAKDVQGAESIVQQTIPMTQQAAAPGAMPPPGTMPPNTMPPNTMAPPGTMPPPGAMPPNAMPPNTMPPGAAPAYPPPPGAPPPRG